MSNTKSIRSHPTSDKMTPLHLIEKTLPLRVMSNDDWQHWITKGFAIVKNVVPRDNVDRLVKLLWEFDEKDPNDPETWYAPQRREHKMKELNNTGMLEIYNHQYLWDNADGAARLRHFCRYLGSRRFVGDN